MSMTPTSLSIVVPVFNNAETLPQLIQELRDVLPSVSSQFEVIFVDDGSTDKSFEIIKQESSNDKRIKGIQLSRNFGQHPALCAGMTHARMEWTVIMDADLEDDPASLRELFKEGARRDDASIILTQIEAGLKPRFSSRVFHWFFGKLNRAVHVANVGTLRAFDSRVREALLSFPERGVVYGPLMSTIGFKTVVVPVKRRHIAGHDSSYSMKRRIQLASTAMLSNTAIVGRAVLWLGLLLSVFTGGYFLVVLAQYLTGSARLPDGMSLIVALLSLTSSVILISLGLLSTYLMTILREVQQRPRYLVQQKIGIADGL
jgi:glycosyltransferase involved in cell wall biosynthesis